MMVLQFKNPAEDDLKKVMVYGTDGSGKSTFAANYCKQNNLNAVVIDIDDTNKTALYHEGRVLKLNLKNDIQTFRSIKNAIAEIKQSAFDTIIVDGVTSLLELLVSDAKGRAKYSDRSTRFQKLLQDLLDSGKNIIFIGQIDMEVIYTEDFQSSKAVIKVNSLVNEKYLCLVDEKGNYTYEVKKYRTVGGNDFTKPESETSQSTLVENDDPIHQTCINIKRILEDDGKKVTKSTMRGMVVKLINEGTIPSGDRPKLIGYINKHCPEAIMNE